MVHSLYRYPCLLLAAVFYCICLVTVQAKLELCELASCDVMLRSRKYDPRCDESQVLGWPLLVTGTPRSQTTFMSQALAYFGMKIHNDWGAPERDGSVSWIFAFEDPANFGPARTHGKKFNTVFHQVKDPIKSVTAMCTEPLFTYTPTGFLEKHINYSTATDTYKDAARSAIQFWLEWHTFLDETKAPTYQVENVVQRDMFEYTGLIDLYKDHSAFDKVINSRKHRAYYDWQEVFTIDPQLAARLWIKAAEYGYVYPGVDFNALTCRDKLPTCSGDSVHSSALCPPGEHPIAPIKTPPAWGINTNDVPGFVTAGCRAMQLEDGTYVGVTQVTGTGYAVTARQLLDLVGDEQATSSNIATSTDEDSTVNDEPPIEPVVEPDTAAASEPNSNIVTNTDDEVAVVDSTTTATTAVVNEAAEEDVDTATASEPASTSDVQSSTVDGSEALTSSLATTQITATTQRNGLPDVLSMVIEPEEGTMAGVYYAVIFCLILAVGLLAKNYSTVENLQSQTVESASPFEYGADDIDDLDGYATVADLPHQAVRVL